MELWYKDCVETGIVSQDMVSITDEQRLDEFATGKAATDSDSSDGQSKVLRKRIRS